VLVTKMLPKMREMKRVRRMRGMRVRMRRQMRVRRGMWGLTIDLDRGRQDLARKTGALSVKQSQQHFNINNIVITYQ
jgi:hypothetical protein